MKIYRVGYFINSESSQGFGYFSNKKDAKASLVEFKEKEGEDYDDGRSSIQELKIELNKKSVLSFLNAWSSHPDNG